MASSQFSEGFTVRNGDGGAEWLPCPQTSRWRVKSQQPLRGPSEAGQGCSLGEGGLVGACGGRACPPPNVHRDSQVSGWWREAGEGPSPPACGPELQLRIHLLCFFPLCRVGFVLAVKAQIPEETKKSPVLDSWTPSCKLEHLLACRVPLTDTLDLPFLQVVV